MGIYGLVGTVATSWQLALIVLYLLLFVAVSVAITIENHLRFMVGLVVVIIVVAIGLFIMIGLVCRWLQQAMLPMDYRLRNLSISWQ